MAKTFEGQHDKIPHAPGDNEVKPKGDAYDRRGTNEDYKGATHDRNIAFLNRRRAGRVDRY